MKQHHDGVVSSSKYWLVVIFRLFALSSFSSSIVQIGLVWNLFVAATRRQTMTGRVEVIESYQYTSMNGTQKCREHAKFRLES